MLAVISARAKKDGQICGIVPHLIEDGLSVFQYTYDTILFLDHDIAQAMNMKLLFCTFEQFFKKVKSSVSCKQSCVRHNILNYLVAK